jgi:hypothetical protein
MIGDTEPEVVDVAWTHVALVHDLLIAYLVAVPDDERFDRQFIMGMLSLLHVPDAGEREKVTAFFLKYVGAHPDRESGIWSAMETILCDYHQHNCDPFAVSPVLTFFLARFKESAETLRQRRREVYENAIVRLISTRHIVSFSARIANVAELFMAEDPTHAKQFLAKLINAFPIGCVSKQVHFVHWIVTTAEHVTPREFKHMSEQIFGLFAKLAIGNSSKVAEASFKIWSNVKIIPMIIDAAKRIFPVIHPAIAEAMNRHWKAGTQQHAFNAIKAMQDLEPFVFEQLKLTSKKKQKGKQQQTSEEAVRVQKTWASIARIATKKYQALPIAGILIKITQFFQNNQGSAPKLLL